MKTKTNAQRFEAFWIAMLLTIWFIVLPFGTAIPAVAETEENYTYTISGYKKKNIITRSDGEKIGGWAFCMDAKAETPSASAGDVFTRVKLSEFTGYTKPFNVGTANEGVTEVTLTDEAKSRLMKLLIEETAIKRFVRNNMRGNYITPAIEETVASGLTTKSANTLNSNWNTLISNYNNDGALLQRLVWCVVHPESEWEEFIKT
ncbi:MAG: hypothetical protein V3G42_13600 [Oscillospiraceae bacterium]